MIRAVAGTDPIEIPRAVLAFEDPWRIPPGVSSIPLVRSTDGGNVRLGTEIGLFHDDKALFVLFAGEDDRIVATMSEHDAPIWREDVVEAFLSPSEPREYFEIEVSPLGTFFDARIVSPHGERSTMNADVSWNCAGLWSAAIRDYKEENAFTFRTVLSIPFSGLGRSTPADGERWRANFFRIDRTPAGDEYAAWRPTLRNPPDFHVPAAFGTLVFRR